MYQSHEFYLRRAIEISKEAREAGNTPFGALLVNKEGEIIMEQGNIEITEKICTGHAEATLDCRAMCDVCRSYLLGEYRKSCIRNDRETTVGADRK